MSQVINQQSWKIWSNFMCPLGPFSLAQSHFKFLLSKFSQIMAKIIIMNVGIDKTFLKFKFSQEIINNGEKCG